MSERSTPVRVLRIIGRLNVGGPAIHTTLLTERLDRTRFESCLVAGRAGPEEGDYLELMSRRLDGHLVVLPELGREVRVLNDLKCVDRLTYLIQEFRPHIVHTHAAKAGTVGRLAAWLCGVPVVVHTYHGHVLRGYFSPRKERVYRGIERAMARLTDELVAVSPRVKAELLEMGIGREDRFSVVPLGFDLDRFADLEPVKGELRRELAVGAAVPLIGIVARLVPIKAHEVFIEAARRILALVPAAHFVIVGDGECRTPLHELVADAGLAAMTHFLGWRSDLERIYADLDVLVLTSRNEGSPVALIEAMAAGCPVVATAVGGVPDVIAHGRTGWLVPRDDVAAVAEATVAVLHQPEVTAAVATAARQRVRDAYGAARLVRDVEAMYERLLQKRGVR